MNVIEVEDLTNLHDQVNNVDETSDYESTVTVLMTVTFLASKLVQAIVKKAFKAFFGKFQGTSRQSFYLFLLYKVNYLISDYHKIA